MIKYFLFCVAFLGFYSNCEAQSLKWTKSIGGIGSESGSGLVLDSHDNIYITGNFQDTVDFDPNFGTSNLYSNGASDFFLLKLDSVGNFIWAKSVGGSLNDFSTSIAIDKYENIYLTGAFSDSVDFNPDTGIVKLLSNGGTDIFISKWDSNGNLKWAHGLGSNLDDIGISMAIDSLNQIYITGSFKEIVDFDSDTSNLYLGSIGNGSDVFVSKYNSQGNIIWAKSIGGNSLDESKSISIDNSSNVYITGRYSGVVDFNPDTAIFNLSTSNTYADAFILKLTSLGEFKWAKRLGGSSYDQGNSIVVDSLGNVYSTGYFWLNVDFDPGPGVALLSSISGYDIYVSKIDSLGNFIWAKRFGGSGYDNSSKLITDHFGNIFLAGVFESTVDFDPGPGINNLVSFGDRDIFILKLDSSGNSVYGKSFGGVLRDGIGALGIDIDGNLISLGYFQSTVDFDPNAGIYNLTSIGSNDIFIQKLSSISLINLIVFQKQNSFLYPNPGDGLFKLNFPSTLKIHKLEVFNFLGQTILEQINVDSNSIIDLTNQAPGVYFVKFKNETNFLNTFKIIKQ